MSVAQLGLEVRSEQAARAAVDLDALTASAGRAERAADSMASGSKRAETATGQMARAVRDAVGANDNATSALHRHVQAIQQLTAAESRMSAGGYAARAADVAAYGRSLDDLRAKFNPTYAAIRQYREQVEQIRQANRLGAISTQEMATALSAERTAALGSLAALRERNTALAARGGVGASYSSNLAAQFQDVAVTSAMGMSPLQIALQQGTQLSAVFNDLKSTGQSTGAALLTAFGSVLSPISLATIAVVGLSAAAIQYFSTIDTGARTSEDVLKDHEALIARIKEQYGEATNALKAYTDESEALQRRSAEQNLAALREQLTRESKAILEGLGTVVEPVSNTTFGAIATGFDESIFVLDKRFAAFKEQIDRFRASVDSGSPSVIKLREEVEAYAASRGDEYTRTLADEFLRLTAAAAQIERGLPGATSAITQIGEAAAAQESAIKSYGEALRALSNLGLPNLSPEDRATQQLERALNNAGGEKWREDLARQQYADAMDRLKLRKDEAASEKAVREAESAAKSKARQAERELQREAERYFDQTRTATEKYAEELANIERLLGKGAISTEVYARATDMANEALEEAVKQERMRALEKSSDPFAGMELGARQYLDSIGNAVQQTADLTAEALSNVEDAFAEWAATGKFNSKDLVDAMIADLARYAARQAMLGLFGSAEGSGGILSTIVSSIFGGSSTPLGMGGIGANANGNAFAGGNVIPFARGGVVSSPTLFPMAAGAGLMGEAGPEAIMPLKRGADGKLGVAGGGGGDTFHVSLSTSIDARGADAAGLARVETQVAQLERKIPALAVKGLLDARKRNIRGV